VRRSRRRIDLLAPVALRRGLVSAALVVACLVAPALPAVAEEASVTPEAPDVTDVVDAPDEAVEPPSSAERLVHEARVDRLPIGVDWASPLPGGGFRVAYEFERVRYAGYRNGQSDLSVAKVRAKGFRQVPTRLERDRHTLALSYAPHDRITLVAEIPWESIEQNGRRPLPGDERYERSTAGLGDVRLTAVVPFIRKRQERSILHLGLSAPTGDIRRKAGDAVRLGYPSRLGTGSWGINWGLAYRGDFEWLSWGAQGGAIIALHENDFDYQAATHYGATAWMAASLYDVWTGSFRLGWSKNGEIHGNDDGIDRTLEPDANDKHQANQTLDLLPGMSLQLPGLRGQRLAVELSVPVFQKVSGPQLERDWTLSAGWQWTF